MLVLSIALVVLAAAMYSAFGSVGFSRQRTEATALANQTLEQIRALPADELFMSMTDAVTDAQLLPSGCITAGTCTFNGRTVPMATFGASPPTTPFLPTHVTTQTPPPGASVYTIKSYLTVDPTDSTGQTRVATVQVNWTQPQQGGVSANVQVESKLHTSSFNDNAPSTHAYTSTATGQGALVSITGALLNRSAVNLGLNFSSTNASFSGGIGGTNVGPTGNLVSGGSAASSLSAAGITPATISSSIATATSPAGSAVDRHTAQVDAGNLSLAGTSGLTSGTISVVSADSNGAATAASRADGTANIPSGNLPNNHLGYGRGTATQSGPIAANLNLGAGLLNLGLVSVTPAGNATPDVSTVAETTSTYTATANKSLSQVKVLSGLLLLPPVVQLDGFTSSVSACAAAPGGTCPTSTATASVADLKISGVDVPFSLTNAVQVVGITPISVSVPLVGTVAVTGNVTIGAASATAPGSASVTSAVKVTLHLQVASLALLDITVDLGSLTASASYT